jgi:ATP-binding cassette subfamily B protein
VSFYRIAPTELQYIDNEGAGTGNPQSLAMEYRRSLVYSVFKGLPRHEVETLAAKLETLQFEAGATIVRQGAPADKFFIIVDGEVDVWREEAPGQASKKVASLKRGQFFGEMAILRDSPRTATVKAVTPTTLLTMDRDVFRNLVAQSLATTEDFDRVIQQRLGEMGSQGRR